MTSQPKQNSTYFLGHADDELQRLIDQARFFGDLTEQVLTQAGIGSGMRVLDIGCGAGDVSFLLSKLVGPSGAVIGIDKAGEAITTARERAAGAWLQNVTFLEEDMSDLSIEQPVDAVVGRLVLMYLPDPAAALRQLARHVRPGGVIAFQEMDMSGIKALPHFRLFEQSNYRITETFRRGKVEIQMGLKLYQTFTAAGLAAPQMIMGARVEGGLDSPVYEYITQVTRTLLPMMEKLGVAQAEEVQIDTLAQRLRDEVVATGGVIVAPPLVGAWARKSSNGKIHS